MRPGTHIFDHQRCQNRKTDFSGGFLGGKAPQAYAGLILASALPSRCEKRPCLLNEVVQMSREVARRSATASLYAVAELDELHHPLEHSESVPREDRGRRGVWKCRRRLRGGCEEAGRRLQGTRGSRHCRVDARVRLLWKWCRRAAAGWCA